MAEIATLRLLAASGASHCGSGRFKAVAEASKATAEASEAILLLWKAIATCYRLLTLFKDYRLSIYVANCQRSGASQAILEKVSLHIKHYVVIRAISAGVRRTGCAGVIPYSAAFLNTSKCIN